MTRRRKNRTERGWSAFQGARTRELRTDGMRRDLAKRIARGETAQRRALAKYIGAEAARSGGMVFQIDDDDRLRLGVTIDDAALRNDFDRLMLALVSRAMNK